MLRFEAALNKTGPAGTEDLSALASSIATSIDPQVVGWWILTALAALVGVIVLGAGAGAPGRHRRRGLPGPARRRRNSATALHLHHGPHGVARLRRRGRGHMPCRRFVRLHTGRRGQPGGPQSRLRLRRVAPRGRGGVGFGGPGRPRDLARAPGVPARLQRRRSGRPAVANRWSGGWLGNSTSACSSESATHSNAGEAAAPCP